MRGSQGMPLSGWFCLAFGAVCLIAAGVLGVFSIQQAVEISAYRHARVCQNGASAHAECLRTVDGSVAGVTEFPGGGRVSADYALDVRTASTTLHLTFNSDSPMLGYAADGDRAVVTLWRGVPVSVETDGRSQATSSVPETALARDLGNGEKSGGVGLLLVTGAWALRRTPQAAGAPAARPVLAAVFLALALAGIVVAIGGIALGGQPSRLGPDLVATGAALVAVLGLATWLGFKAPARSATHDRRMPGPPSASPVRMAGTPLQPGRRPADLARVAGAWAVGYLPALLIVAVLFGVFFTVKDGPPARAFRHATACAGETNLATCTGDFTAVINGIRAPANGASFADVSYVTNDGVINAWARFDGDAATITRLASTDENESVPLTIRVWRRAIIGAELGGSWHWAQGDPPGNTGPTVFLAVSFALLLLMMRLRIHRRAGPGANHLRLLLDDLGQSTAAAGSVILLGYGFWPGSILALAALLWLGLSVGQRGPVRFGWR
jgi:hypothetical protein